MVLSFLDECATVVDKAVFFIWKIMGLASVAVRSRHWEPTTWTVAAEKKLGERGLTYLERDERYLERKGGGPKNLEREERKTSGERRERAE